MLERIGRMLHPFIVPSTADTSSKSHLTYANPNAVSINQLEAHTILFYVGLFMDWQPVNDTMKLWVVRIMKVDHCFKKSTLPPIQQQKWYALSREEDIGVVHWRILSLINSLHPMWEIVSSIYSAGLDFVRARVISQSHLTKQWIKRLKMDGIQQDNRWGVWQHWHWFQKDERIRTVQYTLLSILFYNIAFLISIQILDSHQQWHINTQL